MDPTRNPYERRGDGPMHARPRTTADLDARAASPLAPSTLEDLLAERAPDALTLEDVNDLVSWKSSKTRSETEGIERLRAQQQTHAAARQAWDEGRRAGELDGIFSYWEVLEPPLTQRLAAMGTAIGEALEASPEKQTKRELHEFLARLAGEIENIGGMFNEQLRPDVFTAARNAR